MCLFLVASLNVTEIYLTKYKIKHGSTSQGDPLPSNFKTAAVPYSHPYSFPKARDDPTSTERVQVILGL